MNLKPTPPADAKNRYLKDKKHSVTRKTLYNYDTTLTQFCEWLHEEGIDDLRDLDSDHLQQFREKRLTNVATITARNDMVTVRGFIEFCETIQAVPRGLAELVRIPATNVEDEICDDVLTREEANAILDHLGKFEYASDRHVIFLILWKTGMRLSGLRALDVDDFDEARPALEIRHRPSTGTPLKKKEKGERDVLVSRETGEIIVDYIENQRPDVRDEYGREPLIATEHGRRARTTIQRLVYTATRPCHYTNDCPFDEDPETCEAATWNGASQCPGSVSPHALRRGYVTAARNAGQPKDVTGERVNMTGRVLDKHYDKGSHDEKAKRRQDHLRDI
ncbi:tyrosine-type recombinase/integrase [Halobacterium yunchengense]|uniref:tyrosine-type recombinase/integrase n=1 Tax=Halobacterium yunchengense TaxID=3108497 RepID=UPI00300B5FB6